MSRKELKRSYIMYTDVFNIMLPNCSYDQNNEDINENNTMFETEWINKALFNVLFVLLIVF